jgi:hypothetical protein
VPTFKYSDTHIALSYIGQACAGLNRRYATRCREFRGLVKCERCDRFHCWRHRAEHWCLGEWRKLG